MRKCYRSAGLAKFRISENFVNETTCVKMQEKMFDVFSSDALWSMNLFNLSSQTQKFTNAMSVRIFDSCWCIKNTFDITNSIIILLIKALFWLFRTNWIFGDPTSRMHRVSIFENRVSNIRLRSVTMRFLNPALLWLSYCCFQSSFTRSVFTAIMASQSRTNERLSMSPRSFSLLPSSDLTFLRKRPPFCWSKGGGWKTTFT